MPKSPRRLLSLVTFLSLGQIAGWGSTYYMPSVLAPEFTRDLGLDPWAIYLGVTLMVGLGGLASPLAGRLLDRHGAARLLPIGPLGIGLGHLTLAAFPNATGYYAAWVLFGAAVPFGLTLASTTLLARLGGGSARRHIGFLMLFVGLAPSVYWPITAYLDAQWGWRATIAIYAAIELVVMLPLQLWIARAWPDRDIAGIPTGPSSGTGGPPRLGPRARMTAMVSMVLVFTTQGFAAWGLPLHLIALFQDMGIDRAAAVTIAAASGAATIAARAVEVALGSRVRLLSITGFSVAVMAPALALVWLPVDRLITAWVFIVVWSGACGILSVMRATLPLAVFGAAEYGVLMGRMSLPQNLSFAAAPAIFAVVIDHFGADGAFALAVAASLVSHVAVVVLTRTVRGSQAAMASAPVALPSPGLLPPAPPAATPPVPSPATPPVPSPATPIVPLPGESAVTTPPATVPTPASPAAAVTPVPPAAARPH